MVMSDPVEGKARRDQGERGRGGMRGGAWGRCQDVSEAAGLPAGRQVGRLAATPAAKELTQLSKVEKKEKVPHETFLDRS